MCCPPVCPPLGPSADGGYVRHVVNAAQVPGERTWVIHCTCNWMVEGDNYELLTKSESRHIHCALAPTPRRLRWYQLDREEPWSS